MKKAIGILLIICFVLSLSEVPAVADSSVQVVLSENLTLEDISYEFISGAYSSNPGSVGNLMISATATGPSNIAMVRIAGWSEHQFTADQAREIAGQAVSSWKQYESSFPAISLPHRFSNSCPVSESDLGKTQYFILTGLDTSADLVGFAVVRIEIPSSVDSGDSGTPSTVALSENLTLEDVSYEFIPGADSWNPGSLGFLGIKATVTGPSDIAEVRIGSWSDYQPTADSARQSAAQMVERWNQNESSFPAISLPYDISPARPVFEGDLGKTQYIILVGMDTNADLVGFAVVMVEIPDSGDPGSSSPVALSENLTLEDVSNEFIPGADSWNPGSVGRLIINASVTGPSDIAEVRIGSWSDRQPTVDDAWQSAEQMVERWNQTPTSFTEKDLPYDISLGRPVYEDEIGATQYVLLVGMDTSGNLLGIAVVRVKIPEGGSSFTVSFNTNGGSILEDQVVLNGEQAARPSSPTKDGFWFAGWFTDDSLSTPYDFETAVTNDLVLYAKWITPDFVLPAELTTIEEEAFFGGAFTFVKLSENTETIGARSFSACPYLSYIYIPETTQYIHEDAFGDMQGLTILGTAGSRAESYAYAYDFAFIDIS